MSRQQKKTLLARLSKGMAYTVPAMAIVAGASALSASEVVDESLEGPGYMMLAEGEAEGEAEHPCPEGEAEGEAEGEGEAECPEPEGEGEGEAEG